MSGPALTVAQDALLAFAASAELGAVSLDARDHRPADRLVELGLLRELETLDGRRRCRITVSGDELARHLARRKLGIASE